LSGSFADGAVTGGKLGVLATALASFEGTPLPEEAEVGANGAPEVVSWVLDWESSGIVCAI
jgi:hypothetical protein